MTPLAEILRDQIRRDGPIPFRTFMEVALYHPEYGYYRRDRFGRAGDFFTAGQLQPVFGRIVARHLESWRSRIGEPFQVIELGAGRAEVAPSLATFDYLPVDLDRGALPASFRGVVFSNEFFDALPVDRVFCRDGRIVEARVGWQEGFVWKDGTEADDRTREYLSRYVPHFETSAEIHWAAVEWIERIARSLSAGVHIAIDYGYTARESLRFPDGTLMSYRRHQASPDVLDSPGERDLTAHVAFDALIEYGARAGLEWVSLGTLAQFTLDAGRDDEFAAVLGGDTQLRQQLKTLLFGMGESFRVLIQRKSDVSPPR
ncbi:MAG: class I SAM-dependent methyltransferase [Bryobacteraceae bacterium]